MEWISSFSRREKVAIYCSDVAGAFDRVSSKRLLDKLRKEGVHFRIIDIIAPWLGTRQANVVVGGAKSETFLLSDMVFQGTVLGPILWNLFFGDAHFAIRLAKFTEMMFADDLQAYRSFPQSVPNGTILRCAKNCQVRLHEWGRANQVALIRVKNQ